MDIAKLSISMADAKVVQGVQIGMLKKAMEQMEQTGMQITEMMKTAEIPKDCIIDISI